MADLVGPWKKSSGNGNKTQPVLTAREKATISVVAIHVGLILFFMACIGRLTRWYEKVRYKPENRSNSKQKVDIIEAQYSEVKDE